MKRYKVYFYDGTSAIVNDVRPYQAKLQAVNLREEWNRLVMGGEQETRVIHVQELSYETPKP